MRKRYFSFLALLLLLQSCATFKPQYSSDYKAEVYPEDKKLAHQFFLLGDAGNGLVEDTINHNNSLISQLNKASKNSTLLFLGDNIYPKGMPDKSDANRTDAAEKLQNQIDLAGSFKGKTIFIPGNHDWYNKGVKGLQKEQEFIEKQLGKESFLPRKGCAIETVKISDAVVLIIVDSEWYITNWDHQPTINDDCNLKTRAAFLEEFRSEIKKHRGKTTLVAVHHPMFTNGSHGGQYSFQSHLQPLPVLGSLKNLLRSTTGISNTDIQNKFYNELQKNLVAAAQQNDKVVFVSGHDHNLQYIIEDYIPQIISGSGSKLTPTRNVNGGKFSYAVNGYAVVDVFEDGSSFVRFIDSNTSAVVYQSTLLAPDNQTHTFTVQTDFPPTVKSRIYETEATTKSDFYTFLWGKRYRKSYSTLITAPTVNLDTLFGGLHPVRKGGGNQSKTLRLAAQNGQEYVMRALKKNATQYIQATIFKDQFVANNFKNTASEKLIMDVFTGSYPYAPLVVSSLSEALGVYHLNPKLYHIPKQKALGDFNDKFGDELYFLEEQASDGNLDLKEENFTGNIISTADLFLEMHSDESKTIDEAAYIKARLFDMVINDWDRHQDQWRWLEFKEEEKTVYKVLPRDRDQAFSKMSDGFLLGAAVALIPAAKLLRKNSGDLKDVKSFNMEPYPLDMAFIRSANKAVWDEEVRVIQTLLTDEAIDTAFKEVPTELNDENVIQLKELLKSRRANLQKIADRYFKVINTYGVVTGTDKDDLIKIICKPNGDVDLSLYRKKKDTLELFVHKIFDAKLTKEVWVYGLDDTDSFEVIGKSKKIKIRLIGGQNNDKYTIEDGKNIYIYDYKSKKNTLDAVSNATVKRTDSYDLNTYDYKKLKVNTQQIIPLIGANPDDGLKIGMNAIYTRYGFERNPFTSRHQFKGAYYFATKGFEASYTGEFANVIGDLNLVIESYFQSANFTQNFFGYGNETKNEDNYFGMNYNRVKVRTFGIAPSLVWKARGGSMLSLGTSYQAIEVENTRNRFIQNNPDAPASIFENIQFGGLHTKFEFENYDNKVFPTVGMKFALALGFTQNLEESKRNFVYLTPEISFNHKLVPSGKWVLATQIKSNLIFNSNYEFYQAASIGGTDGLRGFRNQRFTGQRSLFQNTDIRYTFNSLKTNIIPIKLGIYTGFDYGRIWLENEKSEKWNNSYGGGFFINGAELISANLGLFHSIDGLRLAFSLGFKF